MSEQLVVAPTVGLHVNALGFARNPHHPEPTRNDRRLRVARQHRRQISTDLSRLAEARRCLAAPRRCIAAAGRGTGSRRGRSGHGERAGERTWPGAAVADGEPPSSSFVAADGITPPATTEVRQHAATRRERNRAGASNQGPGTGRRTSAAPSSWLRGVRAVAFGRLALTSSAAARAQLPAGRHLLQDPATGLPDIATSSETDFGHAMTIAWTRPLGGVDNVTRFWSYGIYCVEHPPTATPARTLKRESHATRSRGEVLTAGSRPSRNHRRISPPVAGSDGVALRERLRALRPAAAGIDAARAA